MSTGEGLAGGDPWFCDYGPELSRGFRALKIWFTFKCYGVERLALLIEQNCSQARILADLVNDAPDLELCAPVSLNIVCLRFNVDRPADVMDALNRKITATLQLQGIAAPSTTTIKARTVIRVCITNHRTRTEDLVLLTNEIQKIGRQLADALD